MKRRNALVLSGTLSFSLCLTDSAPPPHDKYKFFPLCSTSGPAGFHYGPGGLMIPGIAIEPAPIPFYDVASTGGSAVSEKVDAGSAEFEYSSNDAPAHTTGAILVTLPEADTVGNEASGIPSPPPGMLVAYVLLQFLSDNPIRFFGSSRVVFQSTSIHDGESYTAHLFSYTERDRYVESATFHAAGDATGRVRFELGPVSLGPECVWLAITH